MDAFNEHDIGHESNGYRNKISRLSEFSDEISDFLNIVLNISNF